jgi:hypothetical protein
MHDFPKGTRIHMNENLFNILWWDGQPLTFEVWEIWANGFRREFRRVTKKGKVSHRAVILPDAHINDLNIWLETGKITVVERQPQSTAPCPDPF